MVSVVTGTHANDLAELFVEVLWVGDANAGTDFMDGLRGGGKEGLGFVDSTAKDELAKGDLVLQFEFTGHGSGRKVGLLRDFRKGQGAVQILVDPLE